MHAVQLTTPFVAPLKNAEKCPPRPVASPLDTFSPAYKAVKPWRIDEEKAQLCLTPPSFSEAFDGALARHWHEHIGIVLTGAAVGRLAAQCIIDDEPIFTMLGIAFGGASCGASHLMLMAANVFRERRALCSQRE